MLMLWCNSLRSLTMLAGNWSLQDFNYACFCSSGWSFCSNLSRISVNLYFRQAQLMQSMEGWLFSFENRKYYLWHEEVYWRFRRRVWTWCFEEFEIVLVFDKGKFSSELVEIKQLLSKEKEFKFKGISFLLRRWKQL